MIKQCKIPEYTKRSDIMITSTLSMSIFPKDKRAFQSVNFALMTNDQITEYLDEKNSFAALNKEIEYQMGKMREKDKDFKENYMKSFIHRSNFLSDTLSKFKKRVEKINSNKLVVQTKTKEVVKIEKLKHEQNKRASEKRGLPKFDMEMARKLLDGKFHEDEEEEDIIPMGNPNLNKEFMARDQEDLDRQTKFEEIESQIHKIF